jgi:hypothetical protein
MQRKKEAKKESNGMGYAHVSFLWCCAPIESDNNSGMGCAHVLFIIRFWKAWYQSMSYPKITYFYTV